MTRRDRDRRIKDARDLEIADFLDGYAGAVEGGLTVAQNRLRHPEEIRGPLVTALKGLASSIRAGLVDSALDEGLRDEGVEAA